MSAIKRTPVEIIPIDADAYVAKGYEGPGAVATHLYMSLAVNHSLTLEADKVYVVVWDSADIEGARIGAAKVA